ncbi:autotransporter-associated N-terminal domain-containing protein [Fusobacterium sp. PH5-44]|uniref:autotransporter-associated N-terminal domain-containing protein n=1 Tax=unclassified Fusobacterium TaxID=2648384 RepID=UPI003D1E5487
MKEKVQAESSLKRFLKKKISYTAGLLVSFLITGAIGLASATDVVDLESQVKTSQEALIESIELQKNSVQELLDANEARLKELKQDHMSLIRQGDWYSKPWYPSYFGSLMGWYDYSDSVSKDWKGSARGNTRMDDTRSLFNAMLSEKEAGEHGSILAATQHTHYGRYARYGSGFYSSGWINKTEAYNTNTNVYDYEDRIIILPVVKVPELTKPTAPVVSVNLPATPAKVTQPAASVPSIPAINVNIAQPSVTAPSAPSIPTITVPNLSPITVTDPGVSPSAPTVAVNPSEPNFNINPTPPTLNMSVANVATIPTITVVPPTATTPNPQPNANPYGLFDFQSGNQVNKSSAGVSYNGGGATYWAGMDDTLNYRPGQDSGSSSSRRSSIIYMNGQGATGGFSLSNVNVYAAGKGSSTGKDGEIAIHTVWDGTLSNVKGWLGGQATFISIETWHGGTLTFNNVNVKIVEDNSSIDNSIFYIYPSTYEAINTGHNAHRYRGGFVGTVNADLTTNRNSVYVQSGISGSFKIVSQGTYRLEGSGNTVYSGLGYSPDYEKIKGHGGPIYNTVAFKPSLQFDTAPESYGDNNVMIFFNTKTAFANLPGIYPAGSETISGAEKPFIGFYQGQIKATAKIGEFLSISHGTTQTGYGQTLGTNQEVNANVGIYSKSGQRSEIGTFADLGAPSPSSIMADYSLDPIHNLEIANIDIRFGKYSKDGVMIIADLGTVIDIANPGGGVAGNGEINGGSSNRFSDGINGHTTSESDTATSTVIAFATGAFNNAIHQLGSGVGSLNGKGSEINIYIPLTMTSKEGIAFFAKDKGIINAKSAVPYDSAPAYNATNVATGYKSIIGYADGVGSKIKIDGSIKAIDSSVGALANKYQNIGAFSSAGGNIVVSGKAEINGIGAFADGNNSKIEMKNISNIINSGLKGGVVAINNGKVEFAGTINHGVTGAPGNYNNTVPFYATNGGKVDFTGSTTVNMYKGLLVNGVAADYADSSSNAAEKLAAKYLDMDNVDVVLKADGINVGIFDGESFNYTSESGYLSDLGDFAKLNSLTKDPSVINYDSYLINGSLNITTGTINLDTATAADGFKNITMQNEKVTFSPTTTVSSTAGNGLSLGSNSTAIDNTSTAFINKGIFNIADGTKAPVVLYTNYGTVDNQGTINLTIANDNTGVAIAGVNGSELENSGTVNISSSLASPNSSNNMVVGIAGFATNPSGSPEIYGTDGSATEDPVKITNTGNITITGNYGIGIYANNNNSAGQAKITVTANRTATSGVISSGNNSTGIMMEGTNGGEIKVSSTTGTGDISVGTDSMGIYADNSKLTLATNYGIAMGDDSVGIYTKGTATINGTGKTLTIASSGGTHTKAAAGIFYDGTGGSLTNNINIVNSITTSGTSTAIYAKGSGTLTNNGTLTVAGTGAYGIIVDNVNATNTSGATVTITGNNGIGIYSVNSNISAFGNDLVLSGDDSVGVYAKAGTTARTVTINGTGTLTVAGDKSVGVYIKDTGIGNMRLANNTSAIGFTNPGTPSISTTKVGIYLDDTGTATNTNSGTIAINDYNVGIFAKKANITNTGALTISGNGATGIFIDNSGTGAQTTNISGNSIGVTTTSMVTTDLALGVYAKGNNIEISSGATSNISVSPNAVGIYLDGNNTSKMTGNYNYSLSSEGSNSKIGIGSYYKNGAYGDTGTITIESTSTAMVSGESIRPIGLFYGTGSTKNASALTISSTSDEVIGIYGKGLTFTNETTGTIDINTKSIGAYFTGTDLTNNGTINMASGISGGIGLYLVGGTSSNNAVITVNGNSSIGIVATKDTATSATVTNTSTITLASGNSIGGYAEKGSTFINSGTITGTSTDSIGAFALGNATIENTGTISTANLGMYGAGDGTNGATVKNSGTINITTANKMGILVEKDSSTANLTGGTISSVVGLSDIIGVVANNTAKVNLQGTDISLSGDDTVGISLTNNSVADLDNGNITVGLNGTAVYSKDSTLDISGYTGTLSMGNKGIGLYIDNTTFTTTAGQNLAITYTGTDKGVGLYYTNIAGSLTNDVTVKHSAGGQNLVHIFSDGLTLTNTANQEILDGGIGIYGENASTISNQGQLTLTGDDSVGIYLNSGSILTDIGDIVSTSAPSTGKSKVGVYVNNGDVTGSNPYNFNIPGGIGMYLANNVVSYNGTINITGSSPTSTERTIGIYVAETVPAGNLVSNINVTGADAIGLYLAADASGTPAADITFDGDITITGSSTGNRGLGAYLDKNTTFTLGATGSMTIGGDNNIGFYVSNGAHLNVTGGTVTNTVDGIFAYLDNGHLHFTGGLSPINVNYANVIVNGPSATMINDTIINVGNGGLQGAGGATITNGVTGVINGTTVNAKGMVGTGTGTNLINDGSIVFTGSSSVGIYTENGAHGISTGDVTVGDASVAYYAGQVSGVKGTLEITGTTTIGEQSSIMYANGGDIDYKAGDITVGNKMTALTIEDAGSIVDFYNSNINVNAGGVGVYVTGTGSYDTGVVNLDKLLVNNNGVGIYLDNSTIAFNDNQTIELNGDNAIGILGAKAGTIDYTGNMTGTAKETKGIVSIGANANAKNSGTINMTGDSGIGLFGENANLIENTSSGNITIAKGIGSASSVGIYGKNSVTTSNAGTVTVAEDGVGMYGENTSIINTGNLNNTVGYSTGIYGENAVATNNGNINFGDMANGIFVANGVINNNANVTVGNGTKTVKLGSNPTEYDIKASVGIYGGGNTDVYHNNGATITTGNYGVGIAGETGYIEATNGSNFTLGEESIYMYTDAGTGTNYATLTLSDYSVGMYANTGSLVNESVINVGKSSVVTNDVKISVGMATGTNTTDPVTGVVNHIGGGTITNNATINVGEKNGVGMIANNPTGKGINNGVINVTGDQAYGMEGSEESTIINKGSILVTGTGSRGMAATTGTKVINDYGATIEVKGMNSEGIYVDRKAEAYNYGDIIVDGAGNYGIYVGQGGVVENEGTIILKNGAAKVFEGGGTIVNVGKITIDSHGPTVSMDGITLNNSGVITVNGALDFGKISIGGTDGYIGTINADTFESGEMIVLPTLTQGNNDTVKVVQYLNGAINVPNNGTLTAISHSVTWLADLQACPDNPNTYRIVMVKIPYNYLFEGTPAVELGKGLDEIYEGATGKELSMFDAIDNITNKDELGAVMDMEIRGNVYANLQERILEINDTFDSAFENLRHDRLYTKDSLKIGAITAGGKVKDKNAAIENYDHRTLGVMLLQEYDHRKVGRKSNWSVGFAQTKFDFDNDSEETVYSINLGVGYEDYIGDSTNLKWHSRAEVSINHHDMDRKIHLNNGTYTNNGKFWSAKGIWTNKLRYEIPTESNMIRAGIYGSLKLGYGKYQDFKESGDGMRLHVKSNDMYFIRPGIGADVAFTKYTKRGKFVLTGKALFEYEFGKQYDGANQAKIRDTESGYYGLEKPKDMDAVFRLGAELKYETRYGHSIGLEVMRKEGNVDSTRVGLNLMYRFD